MGMAEIRDAFEAYASGEIAEQELRNALRVAVQAQPDSIPGYVSMASALRRRHLISEELEAMVISDMQAVSGQPIETAPDDFDEETERTFTKAAEDATKARLEPYIDLQPPSAPRVSTGPGSGRATGPGGAWDTHEKLAEPEAPVRIGSVLRERFELVEELGSGGMGVVYKAIDQREIENRGREPYVAIKVLNEDFKRHPESARALQRESKKAMRLAHPNIVLVRDFDRDHGNVYMVMELLHGQPLDQLVLKRYPHGMPLEMVIPIVSGLGAALSHAHQEGILHADFKPSNAFLTSKNLVKVLDFGVARAALALDRGDSTLFDPAKLNAVSPAYASIEMLIGAAPDARDDIYALACVTYFLLTGRHPYNGIDAIKARDAALTPARVKSLADHQWRALRSALVFERWERTPSVKQFVQQFCSDRSERPRMIRAAVAARASRVANAAVSGVTQVTGAAVTRAATATSSVATRTTNAIRAVIGRVRAVAHAIASRPALVAVPAGAALAGALAVILAREWVAYRPSISMKPAATAPVAIEPDPQAAPPAIAPEPAPAQPVAPPSRGEALTAHAQPDANAPPSPAPAGGTSAASDTTAAGQNAVTAPPAAAPAGNPQQQAIDGYAAQARQQIFSGSPATALQTLATARRKYAGSPVLKNLEIVGDRVEEEVERINMAPTLSVKDHEAWLAEIRNLSGEDYPAIDEMLARALANDIADQRARADRPAVIARLLESGRKLFPEHADLLEHGTAGVLDPSQIVVAEDPSDTSAPADAAQPPPSSAPSSNVAATSTAEGK
jgi:serine/threonine protein kinase